MAQFPVTPEREKILARIPDYTVAISPAGERVTVTCDGMVVAQSDKALLMRETRHADVYYLPRSDVRMDLLTRTDHSTYCPFKGHACYWTLTTGGKVHPNIVWSYEDPYPEVRAIRDFVSFYADRTGIETGS
jgi:uncharacterized protein (DUF427 family)